jgi:hypothetical protein
LNVNETTVEKGDAINITSWASDLILSTTIYANFSGTRESVNASSGVNTNITDTDDLGLGVYEIVANVTGNANYTDNSTLETIYVTVEDTTSPQYSDNSTNNTEAGLLTEFSLKWTDNNDLSGYIFSLDNCTETLYNFSWTTMTSKTNWSNYSTVINESSGCTIVWKIYANDSSGNWNASENFSFMTDDTVIPTWSNNQTQLVLVYTPDYYSNFSIDWNDNSGSVSAYLEHNFSGTLQNESVGGSYPTFTYNSSVLAVGDYQFRFVANDSTGNDNVTDTQYFTIVKANYSLELENNISWSGTYPVSSNTTGYGCPGQITCTLYRNDTNVNSGSPVSDLIVLGAGTYNYTYNSSSNANYSVNSTTQLLTISQGVLDLSVNVSPDTTVIYPTTTIGYGNESNIGDSDVIYELYRNDSGLVDGIDPWEDSILLGVGGYEYRFNASGGVNWTANATGVTVVLTVSQNASNPIDIYIDNGTVYVNQNVTITYGTQTTSNSTLVYTDSGTALLWRNGSSMSNPDTVTLGAGSYAYQGNTSGNANYSGNDTGATYYLIVDQAIPYTNLNVNETTVEKGDAINITSWASDLILSTTIYANFSGVRESVNASTGVNTNITDTDDLGLGVYEINANVTGNANYTDNSTLQIIYVTVEDTTSPQYSDDSTNNTDAGLSTEFRLRWTENDDLSGYIFAIDNCTGLLVNDSWVAFSGKTNWSNVTKTVNETEGCTIKWKVYANDSSDNWNASENFSFVTSDNVIPTWSNNQTQLVTVYTPDYYSNFSIDWDDNSGSVNAYLEHNFSGTLQNESMGGSYPTFTYNSTVYWRTIFHGVGRILFLVILLDMDVRVR